MIVIVTLVLAVTIVSLHNIELDILIMLTSSIFFAPQEASHQDWNGVPSHNLDSGLANLDPSLEADTEATSEPSNCDPKENSSGDNNSGDPVAKAIEQRSYRLVLNLNLSNLIIT